ncbi:MAG: hypothetical protein WAV20_01135 [Blastocatellia bacterium]
MAGKSFTRKLAVLVLSMFCLFPIDHPAGTRSSVQAKSNEPLILFYGGDRSIRVEFSDSDLRKVEADITYVITKMDREGARCCGKMRRVSECIWVCCDRQRTQTCHETLKQALKLLWGDY